MEDLASVIQATEYIYFIEIANWKGNAAAVGFLTCRRRNNCILSSATDLEKKITSALILCNKWPNIPQHIYNKITSYCYLFPHTHTWNEGKIHISYNFIKGNKISYL